MVGDNLRLQLLLGPQLATPAPRAVVDAFVSLRVTSATGSRSGFQLSLSMSPASPLHQLLATGALDPKNRIVASVLWRDHVTVLIDGIVTRHDVTPTSIANSGVLTLTGEDLTVLMDLETKYARHDGLQPEAQVRDICEPYGSYGITPDVHDAPEQDTENPQRHSDTQSATDLAYLNQLAADVGYVFYLEPGSTPGVSSAYWGPGLRTGEVQPPLTTNFGTLDTVASLTFDLNGLANTSYVKGGHQISPSDLSQLRPPLARTLSPTLVTRPLPPSAMLDGPQTDLLAGSLIANSMDSVGGHGELDVRRYGHILKARRLVSVRGASQSYDGRYFVVSVTHDLAMGRYRQQFRLTRDGLGTRSNMVPG